MTGPERTRIVIGFGSCLLGGVLIWYTCLDDTIGPAMILGGAFGLCLCGFGAWCVISPFFDVIRLFLFLDRVIVTGLDLKSHRLAIHIRSCKLAAIASWQHGNFWFCHYQMCDLILRYMENCDRVTDLGVLSLALTYRRYQCDPAIVRYFCENLADALITKLLDNRQELARACGPSLIENLRRGSSEQKIGACFVLLYLSPYSEPALSALRALMLNEQEDEAVCCVAYEVLAEMEARLLNDRLEEGQSETNEY
jgi:hypothetical protein